MTLTLPQRRGASLVEVLVVVTIIGILGGMTAAAVMRARAASLRLACGNHLRQLGLALHRYDHTYGSLPPGVVHPRFYPGVPRLYGPDTDPYPLMNWHARLLPYLEQDGLWLQIHQAYLDDPYELASLSHQAVRETQVAIFACPADTPRGVPIGTQGQTSYLGIEGINNARCDGLLFLDSSIRYPAIADGSSNTLLVGERPPSRDLRYGRWHASWGPWGTVNSTLGVQALGVLGWLPGCPDGPYAFGPGRLTDPCSAFHFWSLHAGGANFLFADGAVRFLPYSAAARLPDLATRAGGEIVSWLD